MSILDICLLARSNLDDRILFTVKEIFRLIELVDVFYYSFSPSMAETGHYDGFS